MRQIFWSLVVPASFVPALVPVLAIAEEPDAPPPAEVAPLADDGQRRDEPAAADDETGVTWQTEEPDTGITDPEPVVPVIEDPDPDETPASEGTDTADPSAADASDMAETPASEGTDTADSSAVEASDTAETPASETADPVEAPDADESTAGEAPETTGPPAELFEEADLSERERLELAFSRFQELRGAGMLDEAENAAKQAVEMSLNVSGPGSNDTAKALTNLGMVQYDSKDYGAAEQNFQSAIDIYKTNEDQLSERLINPLRGLGAAQLESGRPDEAMRTFRQAVHISHVNEGPHNAQQLPILEALAETQLRMGSLEDARDTQDMIYVLNLRHNDGDRLGMVEPLMRLAAWQRRTGFVLDERQTYMRVIRIIEDEKGKDDISLIEPLLKLAESYYYIEDSNATLQASAIANGELYFKRAIHIAEDNPEADWRIQARTKLALADYYNFRADLTRSRRAYRDVWDLLSGDEEQLTMRHDVLEQVQALNEDPIPQYVGEATLSGRQQADRDVREGKVIASYDVSSRGRMSSLRIVELDPPAFSDMQDQVVRELRSRLYRPRFVDAEPVDTENLMITHHFFYLQSDLDERLAEAKDSGEEGG